MTGPGADVAELLARLSRLEAESDGWQRRAGELDLLFEQQDAELAAARAEVRTAASEVLGTARRASRWKRVAYVLRDQRDQARATPPAPSRPVELAEVAEPRSQAEGTTKAAAAWKALAKMQREHLATARRMIDRLRAQRPAETPPVAPSVEPAPAKASAPPARAPRRPRGAPAAALPRAALPPRPPPPRPPERFVEELEVALRGDDPPTDPGTGPETEQPADVPPAAPENDPPPVVRLTVLPVEELTMHHQSFFCLPLHATLTAGMCVRRQDDANTRPEGRPTSKGYQQRLRALTSSPCRVCALGGQVRSRVEGEEHVA